MADQSITTPHVGWTETVLARIIRFWDMIIQAQENSPMHRELQTLCNMTDAELEARALDRHAEMVRILGSRLYH